MLDIIVPSIRPEGLQRFVNSVDDSLQDKWRLIVVSPEKCEVIKTPLLQDILYIVDKGSPSRCLQMGADLCDNELMTWGTDDGVYQPGALKECVDLLESKTTFDGIIVKYTENGPGSFTGALDEYYVSGNHEANRQPGINPTWKTCPVGMFYTNRFKHLGGIDCRFEHINMNIHDLAYRLQKSGGELYYSPRVVMHCDSDNWGNSHKILDDAYNCNDLPLFKILYADDSREIYIDFDNWKDSPEEWRRFR